MTTCSNHKKEIVGISDMKMLAEMIGDLDYETLADLLKYLYDKLQKDGQKDIDGGRTSLGNELLDAAFSVDAASSHIEKAWQITL